MQKGNNWSKVHIGFFKIFQQKSYLNSIKIEKKVPESLIKNKMHMIYPCHKNEQGIFKTDPITSVMSRARRINTLLTLCLKKNIILWRIFFLFSSIHLALHVVIYDSSYFCWLIPNVIKRTPLFGWKKNTSANLKTGLSKEVFYYARLHVRVSQVTFLFVVLSETLSTFFFRRVVERWG